MNRLWTFNWHLSSMNLIAMMLSSAVNSSVSYPIISLRSVALNYSCICNFDCLMDTIWSFKYWTWVYFHVSKDNWRDFLWYLIIKFPTLFRFTTYFFHLLNYEYLVFRSLFWSNLEIIKIFLTSWLFLRLENLIDCIP